MSKPEIIERFGDNGEHSHWELIGDDAEVLWTEDADHPLNTFAPANVGVSVDWEKIEKHLSEVVLNRTASPAIKADLTVQYLKSHLNVAGEVKP